MKRIILYLITFYLSLPLLAQDIHFSQYYNTPLLVNPALTGKVYGTFRITLNYRNQWFGISSYSTPAIAVDVPVRFKSKDVLGIGVYAVNDRSANGNLTNMTTMFALAFHKALGESKGHSISFGAQVGYTQRKLDVANLRFTDQINLENKIEDYNPSGENLEGSNGNLDVNVGIHWNSKMSNKANIFLGYAVFHVTQPEQSFVNLNYQIPIRHTVNGGLNLDLSNKVNLTPSVLYMLQEKATDLVVGATSRFKVSQESALLLGAFYRLNDAVIPYFGLKIKTVRFGFSYDVTMSQLNGTTGGIEVSLSLIGKYIPVPDVKPSLYSPRF